MRAVLVQGAAVLSLVLAACGDHTPTGPNPRDLVIAVQDGDQQVSLVGAALPRPLQVAVKNASSKAPQKGVAVTWTVTGGGSAYPARSTTDSAGIASTTVTLGPTPAILTVTANFSGNIGQAATFTAEATTGATVSSIAPTSARAGDTITVVGSGFSTIPQNNVVLFDGVRGAVVGSTATQLRVVVPLCLPTRIVQVRVVLGPTTSTPAPLAVTGVAGAELTLTIGQVTLLTDPSTAACVRLPAGGAYLVTVENASSVSGTSMDYQLMGLGSGPASAVASILSRPAPPAIASPATDDAQLQAELRIRELEHQLLRDAGPGGGMMPQAGVASAALPAVGDSATFNVLNNLGANTFTKVKAKVKLVSAHAILYQDVRAPANGFQTADFQRFGQLFDDPIFPTDSSVYGSPSDVDANGRVIILFTAAVNALSPRDASSFVAGLFFGCDLVTVQRCSGSNRAEIIYAAVPDPEGTLGPTLTTTRILQMTPPVLAHELTHMIGWNQRVVLRGGTEDAAWLDEALAHTAEDTVGGVFLARGDSTAAVQFMQENWRRANEYLAATAWTHPLELTPSAGTLAERGAEWLILKYLRGRFDTPGRGTSILTKLTQTTLSSTDNVTAQTGLPWNVLLNDWTIALWADNAPQLAAAPVDPRYRFPNINLRATLGQPAFGGFYRLQPPSEPFTGFTVTGTVVSSAAAYFILNGSSTSGPLSLGFSGLRGLPFAGQVVPQLGIMRIR